MSKSSISTDSSGRGRHLLLAALVSIGGCELMQPQPDPMLQRVAEIERRLAALERILASGSLIELTVQVDELQRQVADLRGRADTIEYETGTTAGRQRDLYADLDDRIRLLEERQRAQAAAMVEVTRREPDAVLPVPGGTDRENYEAALEILKQQDYVAAGSAFREFLRRYPDSLLADNAQYWLAETYYVTGEFEEALVQFQLVLSGYPRSRKLPDAMLKVGYSEYALQRWDAARETLGRVRREFPDSTAATLAEQRLQRMREEGH